MKIKVAALALLLISYCSVVSFANSLPDHGKDGRISKPGFKAKVVLLSDKVITGYFFKVADDSVHLFVPKVSDMVRIPVTDVQAIKLRRKGAIWKGAVIGVATGLTAGIVLTSVSLKGQSDVQGEESDGFAYVIGAVVGYAYAYGGLTGMLIGMHQRKFKINGYLQDRTARKLERFNAEAPR